MTDAALTDPLHWSGAPSRATWTTTNVAEAIRGVPTPLTWSWFQPAIDASLFGALYSMGALSRAEYRADHTGDAAGSAIFHGRPALNVGQFRAMISRLPTMSGDGVEEQLFGGVHVGAQLGEGSRRRYPFIALQTPPQFLSITTRLRRAHADTLAWWRASIPAPTETAAARVLLAEGFERYVHLFQLHALASMLGMVLYDQLAAAARRAGLDGYENRLVTGYGSLIEDQMLRDIWAMSRGSSSEATVLAAHGYHSPDSGELSGLAWREDPAPLRDTVARFAGAAEEHGPARLLERARKERELVQREVLSRTSPGRRPALRAVMRLARAIIPYRELGKASFLLAMDVGRAAARGLGTGLADRGLLAEADDTFYFTHDELVAGPPGDLAEVVAARRAQRSRYAGMRLPEVWTGMPEVTTHEVAPTPGEAGTIRGLPVSAGVVRGTARVIREPDDLAGFEHGDVLVCQTTDPSWAPLIMQAGAMVIDIGGAMSHGAIVARELGVPCVINTVHGTTLIGDGDTVEVDGSSGTVDVIRTGAAQEIR